MVGGFFICPRFQSGTVWLRSGVGTLTLLSQVVYFSRTFTTTEAYSSPGAIFN